MLNLNRFEHVGLAILFTVAPILVMAAGPGGTGGGDAFICVTDGHEEVYLADTYDIFRKSDHIESKVLHESLVQFVIGATSLQIAAENPKISKENAAELIRAKYESLKFRNAHGPFQDLPDDNISNPPLGCEKQQLAIQNVKTGEVFVNKNLASRLKFGQDKIFRLHESIIAARSELGIDMTYTTKTRELVALGVQKTHDLVKSIFNNQQKLSADPTKSYRMFAYGSDDKVLLAMALATGQLSVIDWVFNFPIENLEGAWTSTQNSKKIFDRLSVDKDKVQYRSFCRTLRDAMTFVFWDRNLVWEMNSSHDEMSNGKCASLTLHDLMERAATSEFRSTNSCSEGYLTSVRQVNSKLNQKDFENTLKDNQTVIQTIYSRGNYQYTVRSSSNDVACKIP